MNEAIEIATNGINAVPGDAELHIHLGYLLLNAARLEDAQAQFEIVLGQLPQHAGALTGKSNVLAAYGRQAEAIELMREAIGLAPQDAGMRVWLGQLLLVVGDPLEAEPHFRVALELAPQVGAAHIGLARALERTGRLEEARHVAADAAAVLPHDTRVQAIHRRMGPPDTAKPEPVEDAESQRAPPACAACWVPSSGARARHPVRRLPDRGVAPRPRSLLPAAGPRPPPPARRRW
ncbi:tetratricopeptide repeat protein [Pseudoroseomonas wenyumeiae]